MQPPFSLFLNSSCYYLNISVLSYEVSRYWIHVSYKSWVAQSVLENLENGDTMDWIFPKSYAYIEALTSTLPLWLYLETEHLKRWLRLIESEG